MNYRYANSMSRIHTTKLTARYHPEWHNQDIPSIYREDGSTAIEITFPNYEAITFPIDDNEFKVLKDFLKANRFTDEKIY